MKNKLKITLPALVLAVLFLAGCVTPSTPADTSADTAADVTSDVTSLTPADTTTAVPSDTVPTDTTAVVTTPAVTVPTDTTPEVTTKFIPGTEATTAPVVPETPERDYSALVPLASQTMIIYEPNGGVLGSVFGGKTSVSDSATHKITCTKADGYFYQTVTDSYYLCPHAMGDKNYLARDGYVLVGYNTKPDGTGDYYACGWNVPVEKGHKIVLYAIWAKETPASDFVISSGVLKRYNGNADTVVVPKSVTEIASGAFTGKSLSTAVLPKSVTEIASGAFDNCPKLSKVYMTDLVTLMPGDSFKNCGAFKTLVINNATSIKYIGSTTKEGSYCIKFQRLLMNRDKKKVVFISGSNAVYGLDSAYMEQLLGGGYEIINYGTNYYVNASLYLDVASHFVKDGDIIVTLPEEVPQQWGGLTSTNNYAQFFPAAEGCMEIISYIDISLYPNLFSQIAKYNGLRAGGGNSYESVAGEGYQVNEYGDMDLERTTPASKFSNTSLNDWFGADMRASYFTDANVNNLNRAFDACVASGAKIFISFTVIDGASVTDVSAATVGAYEADVAKYFVTGKSGRYLISSQSDYIFDHSCFYNSMHHLLSAPARVRTEMLAGDIKAALAKLN